MALKVFERWSPESALNNTFDDIRESGLDGLKQHLTANALKKVEGIDNISSSPGVSMITTAFMGGSALKVFLDKLAECEWDIKDVMKGSETSKAVVGFNYEDKMIGTVEMTLIKEEKIWKIDNLDTPKFDKFAM